MHRMQLCCTAFLILAAACSDDPVRKDLSEQDTFSSQSDAVALLRGDDHRGNRRIAMLDDCDPRDPSWNATGGCHHRRGDVTEAEFRAFLLSPLSSAVVGHQAWRNQPTYLKIKEGETVRVENDGGRLHTFTRVANFGGGRVPPLNVGLLPAPECALAPGAIDPTAAPPGGRLEVRGLGVGNHRFQCCLHPWMRAHIKVQPHHHDDDSDD